ncbi:MAG: hypothetical protein HFJ32_02085 [Clostridia bacterium]|nr:hypothetical protein [Clostridia bacterium]
MRTERMKSYWKEHKMVCLLLMAAIVVLSILIGSRIRHIVAVYQAASSGSI